jgi:hypothetical protein
MAVTRAKTSSVAQGPSTSKTFLAGNPVILPGSYESIASASGTGSSGTITFSSIPSTYKHLQIRCFTSQSATNANNSALISFNSDTTNTNYYWHRLLGNGTAASASASQIRRIIEVGGSNTYPAASIIDILDYSNTNKNKTVRVLNGLNDNGTNGWDAMVLTSLLWNNTSAINSISIIADTSALWNTASTFALYGIK